MKIIQLPLDEIAMLSTFNHRKSLTTDSCQTLARSIHESGLQSPIVVRELSRDRPKPMDVKVPSDAELLDQGFKYKVISGHRRYTAYCYLRKVHGEDYAKIFANVREADIPEVVEYDLNALENLERKEVTPYEEALIIEKYTIRGFTAERIGDHIGKPPSWVKLRMDVLKMPYPVQELLHEGKLTISDIRVLRKHVDDQKKLLQLAGQIRDTRISGGSISALFQRKDRPAKPPANQTKPRTRTEVFDLQEQIREICKMYRDDIPSGIDPTRFFTPGGNSILTRLLGWVAGYVSNKLMYDELEDFLNELNIPFKQEMS